MIRRSAAMAALALALTAAPAGAAPVVTGTLDGAAGNPAAGVVTVYAWPTGRGKREMQVVGREVVGPSGRFAVGVSDPVAASSAIAPRDDWADFLVIGETADATGSTVMSAQMRGGATATATAVRTVEHVVLTADSPRPMVHASQSCPPPVSTRLGGEKSDGVIGEINNAYRDTSASFAYGERADTTASVAFKPSGSGGWSLDGSVHRGTERENEISVTRNGRYSRKITSEFIVGRYRIVDPCRPSENGQRLKVDRWAGGFKDGRRQTGTLNVCRPGVKGTQDFDGFGYFRRDDGRATTWSAGIEAFGVSLTTRSGFSEWVRLRFDFPRRPVRTRYLCGGGGVDVNHAQRIFSGAA
jgi:hypothetical protein